MMADRSNSDPAGLGNQALRGLQAAADGKHIGRDGSIAGDGNITRSTSPLTSTVVGQGDHGHLLTEQHRHEINGHIALLLLE